MISSGYFLQSYTISNCCSVKEETIKLYFLICEEKENRKVRL